MPTQLIQTGIPQVPAGLPDKEHRLLSPLYLAINALAKKFAEVTGQVNYSDDEAAQINQVSTMLSQNLNRVYLKATETVAYGKMCNIHLDGGKLSARLADSTNASKPAHAICDDTAGLVAGEYGPFILGTGYSAGITGTAVGTIYYLGTTGDSQAARPAAAGTIIQAVGIGLGSAGFYVQISSLFIQN
jgi:hypothetical protein